MADQESVPRHRVERPNPAGRVIDDQRHGPKFGERGDPEEAAVFGTVGPDDCLPLALGQCMEAPQLECARVGTSLDRAGPVALADHPMEEHGVIADDGREREAVRAGWSRRPNSSFQLPAGHSYSRRPTT